MKERKRRRKERDGKEEEAGEERDIEKEEGEAACLCVSPAIFQAVFLQDNGFSGGPIKIIQMTWPAVNSIRECTRRHASSSTVYRARSRPAADDDASSRRSFISTPYAREPQPAWVTPVR